MRNRKNRQPHNDLTQICKGGKSVCLFWIHPTENLQSHPRTSFRINELWYNKHDTLKSTINKRRLEPRTWRIFYIKRSNKLKQKSLNNQPETSTQPSTNLLGSKYVCTVWIQPTDNFQSHPRISFSISERWYDQCKQTSQQS